MQSMVRIFRWLAVIVFFASAVLVCLQTDFSSIQAATVKLNNSPLPNPSPPDTTPPSSQSSNSAESNAAGQAADQIIELVSKKPKEPQHEGPATGPPAKQDMLADELRIRAQFVKDQLEQARLSEERARNAKNPAEAQIYAKDARLKAEAAQSAAQSLGVTPPQSAPPQADTGRPSGGGQTEMGSRINFNSGALRQLQNSNEILRDVENKSEAGAKERAIKSFGEGQAGAGGVALYKAATMLTPLDRSKITMASLEDGRLVLLYDGQKLRFPPFDPQFLALVIRSVYGGEGLVKGTLIANERNAVVISTGKDRYGEVAWKKEFLPDLPQNLTEGQELALDLGPGVGALSLPEPSYERITYYGPLRGNTLGQVLQESDMVFMMFWGGVDWRTGLPLDPGKLSGYESRADLMLRHPQTESSPRKEEKAKHWWDDTVWFVWTPDEFSLQLQPGSTEFEFAKATMKVTVWSAQEANVDAREKFEGEYLTQHYDDFARAFPVLARLKEAAKVVAAVRWLKNNQVPLDLGWANSYKLSKIDTLDKVLRFSVNIHRDKSGKPLVENPQ